jgi:hypothetical protein
VPGRHDRPASSAGEDLPEQLVLPLWEWLQSCFVNDRRLLRDLDEQLRLDLGQTTSAAAFATGMLTVRERALRDRGFLLDLVSTVLDLRYASGQTWFEAASKRLESILASVESPYAVTPEGSGLTRPETPRSYDEAVGAVEAALVTVGAAGAVPLTLTAWIDELEADPAGWRFALGSPPDSLRTVLAMLRLLRDAPTSRPGGAAPGPEGDLALQAAFHLAETLVHWLSSGALHRNEPGPSG